MKRCSKIYEKIYLKNYAWAHGDISSQGKPSVSMMYIVQTNNNQNKQEVLMPRS